MNRADLVERVRSGLAPLPDRRRDPQSPSRWAWAADVMLAVFLSASTVYAASRTPGYDMGVGPVRVAGVTDPSVPPAPPIPPVMPGLRPGIGSAAVSQPLWLLVLAALAALPLAVRRRYPLAAYWAVLAMTLAFHLAETTPVQGVDDTTVFTFVGWLIAGYSAAIHSTDRRAMAWSLAVGTVLVAVLHQKTIPAITPGFVPFLLLVPIGLAANTIHTWRQRLRSMEEAQAAATALAVERERARIARELHDVVTHNVSMMTVQAGAARKVMGTAPELAEQALLSVEAGGRAAMTELRHVMGLLTMPSDAGDPAAAELAPQPGLDQVDALAGRMRDTGVRIDLVVSGTPAPLPPGVDLAAYRVVQEALTNTVKHAAGATVRVTVDHGPDAVRIEVADTGGARSESVAAGNGRGLVGLRERLAVYGGTLDAGRRIGGGYRISAVIPMGDV